MPCLAFVARCVDLPPSKNVFESGIHIACTARTAHPLTARAVRQVRVEAQLLPAEHMEFGGSGDSVGTSRGCAAGFVARICRRSGVKK